MQSPAEFLVAQRARLVADAGAADLTQEPWRSRLHFVDTLQQEDCSVQGLLDTLSLVGLGGRRAADEGFDPGVTRRLALVLQDRFEAERRRVQG